jgi:CRP-like cAMP-binding protein
MFENWWKMKAGIADDGVVLLPEFVSGRLRESASNLTSFTGAARTDAWLPEEDGHMWAPRTVWVGEIAKIHATPAAVESFFAALGPIVSVNVRMKDSKDRLARNQSWALVTFHDEADAYRASKLGRKKDQPIQSTKSRLHRKRGGIGDANSVPFVVEMVQIDQLQRTRSGQSMRITQEIDVGNRGKALWIFVGSQLRSLMNMRKVWGDVTTLYQSRDASIYQAMPLPPFIRDPSSWQSMLWDILQVVAIIYISATVPLRICFGMAVRPGSLAFSFDVAVEIIFVIDVVLNFRTAFVDATGVLEERPRKIAKHYLQGWFLPDILSCLPIQYIAEDASAGSGAKAAKALRLVRLTKMLRLSKVKEIIARQMGAQYGLVSEASGFLFVFMLILYAGHLLACCWYIIGTSNELMPTISLSDELSSWEGRGWVQAEYCCSDGELPPCDGGASSRPCSVEMLALVPIGDRYITSLYYVFNALEAANTNSERGFAVFAELCVAFIFGSLAGVMSALSLTLRGNKAEVAQKLRQLKLWLELKELPNDEQKKITDYFHATWMSNKQIDYARILDEMPPLMANGVVTKLYSRVLETNPLFTGLSHEIIAALCHKVVPMTAVKDQHIMLQGSPGRELFMLIKGEVEMLADGTRMGFLGDGAFFGETAVLSADSGSETRSRTVIAVTKCELCFLRKESMLELRERYKELNARIVRFQRAGIKMTRDQRDRLNQHLGALQKMGGRPKNGDEKHSFQNARPHEQGQQQHTAHDTDDITGVSARAAHSQDQRLQTIEADMAGMRAALDQITTQLKPMAAALSELSTR